jgi:hypothetical protein
MKKNRGLYHVSVRRYLNFSSSTSSEILVILTKPTVIYKLQYVLFIFTSTVCYRYEGEWEKGLRHGKGKYVR